MSDDDDSYEICSNCAGSGEGMYDGSTCYVCHGKGEIYMGEHDEEDYEDEAIPDF